MNLPAKQHGFSLLEVLVAFTVTMMAVAVIYRIYASGNTTTLLGREYLRAGLLAERLLASLVMEEAMENGTAAGLEEDRFHWEIRIDDFIYEEGYHTGEPAVKLKRVNLSVHWESKGKTRQIHLETLKPYFDDDEA